METLELKEQLKRQIIQFLNLTDLTPGDIKDDEPLFSDGLGLDSIDSLELIVLLKKEYGIDIRDPREGRKVLDGCGHHGGLYTRARDKVSLSKLLFKSKIGRK